MQIRFIQCMKHICTLGDYIRRNGIGSMFACLTSFIFLCNPFNMWIVTLITLMFDTLS